MAITFRSAKQFATDKIKAMSPGARRVAIANEGGDQVVRNAYEKAVAGGKYEGTLSAFAKERGMKLRKRR